MKIEFIKKYWKIIETFGRLRSCSSEICINNTPFSQKVVEKTKNPVTGTPATG